MVSSNIETIKYYVSKNYPIRKISKMSRLPISTVHYNIRKLSKDYRKLTKAKIRVRRNQILGELLGIVCGDGSFNENYAVRVHLSSKEQNYAKFIKRLFLDSFNKTPYQVNRKSDLTLCLKSKVVYNYFSNYLSWKRPKTYSIRLKTRIGSTEFAKGFLRGHFDTDGNVDDWKGGYKRLTLTTASKHLAADLKYYLKMLGIKYYVRIHGNTYRIRIDKENAIKFIRLVGTHNNRYNYDGIKLVGSPGFEPESEGISQ